jgi:hypothetical protein
MGGGFFPKLTVNLNISRKGTGCNGGACGPGVQGTFSGVEAVAGVYYWKSSWCDGTREVSSGDWESTKKSIELLKKWLSCAIDREKPSSDACLRASQAIVAWGGDRNPRVGAVRFLRGEGGNLANYLSRAKRVLSLSEASLDKLDGICEMNAMLTKVHALAAVDGLPIYDSRVAGAIGALVEMHRQDLKKPWQTIPSPLRFMARACPEKPDFLNLPDF